MTFWNRLARLVGTCLPSTAAERRQQEIRDAEERWRTRNAAAKAAGCPCGDKATVVREHHGTLGSVPFEAWTCAEHAGAVSFSASGGTVIAHWKREERCDGCGTARRCGGRTVNIATGTITGYRCPLRPADPDSVLQGG